MYPDNQRKSDGYGFLLVSLIVIMTGVGFGMFFASAPQASASHHIEAQRVVGVKVAALR